MKRGHMINKLKKAFPEIDGICKSEDLGYHEGYIHLGDCAEGGTIDGTPACDYYTEDYREVLYVMGVHKELHKLCGENGWYVECQNPGQYNAYEM